MKLFAEKRRRFPDPHQTLDDIVTMSDEMDVDTLLEAYSFGMFPWPHELLPTLWFCPEKRGVLEFDEIHVSRSLAKFQKTCDYTFSMNKDFPAVIQACADVPRPGESGTWITEHLMRSYIEFHKAGYAHSVECWSDGELVGGLYGVYVAGIFSAESMFFRKDNASQMCLLHLIEVLKANDVTWMDIQMVTPHLEKLGGKYIPRGDFLKRVDECKKKAQALSI